jgi:S-ribosylhomocysteine lyase
MELKQIASFAVDHTKLDPGMYTSRIDGDVITYDIRMKKPNAGDYFTTAAGHSMEHLFATYVRSGELSDHVIYVGPMGCRTGFYLLVRDLTPEQAIKLTQDAMAFIATYDGPVPGATEKECGNYRDQDLEGARELATDMSRVLEGWTPEKLAYKK